MLDILVVTPGYLQVYDGMTQFPSSTLLSTNHMTADQLKYKSCDVIG